MNGRAPVAFDGVSMVIPAYNEAGNIRRAVESALPVIQSLHSHHELIVVESGSTDGTGEILDDLAAQHPALRVIHQGAKLGLGRALIEGFGAARYEQLLYIDGDNPYDITEFQRALPLLAECDIINGFRLSRDDAWVRRMYTTVFRFVLRGLFNVRLRDANIGFKLMRHSVIQSLDLQSRGFLIDAELLIKAQHRGYRIREFGVVYQHRTSGTSTITARAALRIGWELLGLRWRLWRAGAAQASGRPRRTVVFTADDFGLSPGINQGILECCRDGVVTRVSLMVNMPSAEDALAMIRPLAHVAVGLHLNLVKGRPLSDPRAVPSLVNRQGEFYTLPQFLLRLYTGRVTREDLAKEIHAQLAWGSRHGLTFSHLDSHRHAHLFPPVFSLTQEAAAACGLREIRIPLARSCVRDGWTPKQLVLQYLARRAARRVAPPCTSVAQAYAELRLLLDARAGGLVDGFLRVLNRMDGPTIEIGCHPGYRDETVSGIESRIHDRTAERSLLTNASLHAQLCAQGWQIEGFATELNKGD